MTSKSKSKLHEPTFVTPHNTNYDEQFALILQTHKNSCNHQSNSTRNNTPFVCESLVRILSQAIDRNHIIKNTTLSSFYNLITFSKQSYYNKSTCVMYNPKTIIDFTNKLFEHQIPELDLLKSLVSSNIFDVCFVNIATNEKFSEIDNDYLKFLIVELSNPRYGNRYSTLHNKIAETIPITGDNLLTLCNCHNFILTQKLAEIINKSDKTEIDKLFNNVKIMKIACSNLPHASNVVIALLNKNYKITTDNFESICDHCVFKDIKYILELSRMEITSKHFKAIIHTEDLCEGSFDFDSSEDSEGNYNIPVKANDNSLENRLTKMELLFHNGFIPNKDDIKSTIISHIEIPNIERFDIVLDDELLGLCRTNNFYPKYKFSGIAPELLELQEACHNKNFASAKKLIKTHNVIPDTTCMEIISKFKENKILDLLIQSGGKVNINCVKKRAECYANNKFMLTMINAFENDNIKEITQYKNKILELEKFIKENVSDEIKMHTIINLNIDDDKIKEYQLKYKNKKVPHKKVMEFFEIDKTQKINYVDFKNLLVEKINKEVWKYNNDDKLICIPLKYRILFGLDDNNNNVISIDDLDKLVCLFFINL